MSKNRSISSTSSLHILVAEDNDLNRKVTLAMLERLGHKADTAVDGIEATMEIRRRYHNGPQKCLEAGMNEYIIKPMMVNDLEVVLSNYQRSSRYTKVLPRSNPRSV